MSYLHLPRLGIYGTFQAGGSTANNVLAARNEVNTAAFDPGKNLWHNNNFASNEFRILDSSTRVVSAWDLNGPVTTDPVLGAAVGGLGVMADLDPEHRRVTDLFGFELHVKSFVSGKLRPTQLRDFWVTRAEVEGGVFPVSTVWQSVLDNLSWPEIDQSEVLKQLREASRDALSVRLAMTHFNGPAGTGKLAAVIGPHLDGEPEQIAPPRRLTCLDYNPDYPGFPVASFLVNEKQKKLVVDLANLIPRSFASLSVLLLGGLTAEAGGMVIPPVRDLTVGDWLRSACLVEWDLTDAAVGLLANSPLSLEFTQDPTGVPMLVRLREQPDGKYVDVDRRSLRLNPNDGEDVHVYARQFGRPLAGEDIPFYLQKQKAGGPIRSLHIQPGDPYYPPKPDALINSAPADVFDPVPPFFLTTDNNGRADLRLTVKPGPFTFPTERQSINSQLYFLGDPYGWQRWGALGPEVGAGCALTALVFNSGPSRTDSTPPTWAEVAPIFQRYARLYPFMNQFLDLADEAAVRQLAAVILARLRFPDHREYMPVTRDLSKYEHDLIVSYLRSV